MIEILIQLDQCGHLRKLVKSGLMSPSVLNYYNIYLEVDKYKRTTNMRMTDIVSLVSENFGLSESTVYDICKKMKSL